MTRRIILSLILLLLLPVALGAQSSSNDKMSITSFALDPTDLTANLKGTTVIDQNGEKCALLKIRTTETGFAFSFGMTMPIKTEYKTAEVWVYVPHGVKKMKVQHPQLGTLEYSIPVQVDKARTYVVELVTASVIMVVENRPTKQFVVFNVTPSNAIVEFGAEVLDLTDGTAQKYVDFGTYTYKVQLKNYYTSEGTVVVNNPDDKVEVNVNLTPAFGFLSIPDTPAANGASVFIDDKHVGTVPFKSEAISKGEYTLRLSKPLYKNFTQTVSIPDGGNTLSIAPELERNYAEIKVVVMSGAELWLDGEKKSVGNWSGKVGCGSHLFEVRKAGYRKKAKSIDIFPEPLNQTIQMPEPEPIYGYAAITSTPIAAKVTIDGVSAGVTPIQKKLLIGTHRLVFSLNGYTTITTDIEITENGFAEKNVTLSKAVAAAGAAAAGAGAAAAAGAGSGAGAAGAGSGGGNGIGADSGNVAAADGIINGYEYVDLGLSVKWATCNVGASKPEEYGRYYQWAGTTDVTSTSIYLDWSHCPYHTGGEEESGWIKYNTKSSYGAVDNKRVLELSDDVAHTIWRGSWRTPTDAEWTELRENCTWTWTTINSIDGYKVTSKKSGYTDKYIFLPAAGYRSDDYLYHRGFDGGYWSSSLFTDYPYNAWNVYFYSGDVFTSRNFRSKGLSVRPVCE